MIRLRLRTYLMSILLAAAFLVSPPLAGQGAQRDTIARTLADSAAANAASVGAPVVIGMDTLFRLYGSLGPFRPESRAAAAQARFREVASSIVAGDTIVITDRGAFSELTLNGVPLMTVLDEDAFPLGVPRSALARTYAAAAVGIIRADAERRTGRAILLGAVYAVLATVVLALLLKLIAYVFPRLTRRIEALRRVRLPAVRIQDFEVLSAGRMSALLGGAATVFRLVLILALFYVYVPLVLSFFPWTAPLSSRIVGYAVRPFAAAWIAFLAYLPNLFYLAAGIIITRYVLAFLRVLRDGVSSGAVKFENFYADWAEPTYKIMRVLVFVIALALLYPYLPGAESDAFKGVSIFAGILFSLGSSAAVGNMVAGVVLTYTRAFQVGDRVKIGDTVGDVAEKTLLVTRLRTIKNVAVTIPNGAVLGSQVVNYTAHAATRGLILHTSVTIGYDAPWRQVHELLIEGARRTEHILAEPAPFVFQTSLDDFYVSYELNAATDRADLMAATYSKMHANIQETFASGGVEIMSPHYRTLRDGNRITIPESYLPADYAVPPFRVERLDAQLGSPGGSAGT